MGFGRINKMKKSTIIWVVVAVIIAILLIWGLVGSSKAAEIGITCDLGMGEDGSVFCWKWHQNIIGDVGEALSEMFDK